MFPKLLGPYTKHFSIFVKFLLLLIDTFWDMTWWILYRPHFNFGFRLCPSTILGCHIAFKTVWKIIFGGRLHICGSRVECEQCVLPVHSIEDDRMESVDVLLCLYHSCAWVSQKLTVSHFRSLRSLELLVCIHRETFASIGHKSL